MKLLSQISLFVIPAILVSLFAAGQNNTAIPSGKPQRLEAPFDKVKRIDSPAGRFALIGVSEAEQCPKCGATWSIQLLDTETGKQTLLAVFNSGLSAGWSPDGRSFFVEDWKYHGYTESYLYETNTLKKIDLQEALMNAYPELRKYDLKNGYSAHTHLLVNGWQGSSHLLFRFVGDTNAIPKKKECDFIPVKCFAFRASIDFSGHIEMVKRQLGKVHANGCPF